MSFLLEITKSQYGDKIIKTAGIAETAAFGLKILLIGIATVFSVLCLIWLCLSIFKSVFSGHSEKASKPAKAEEAVAAPVAPSAGSSDDEIVAVIAAAIAAAESDSAGGAKFRVVSFKRKSYLLKGFLR